MEGAAVMNSHESGLNLKATELRLGLPGCIDESEVTISAAKNNNKRTSPDDDSTQDIATNPNSSSTPALKEQIVGWPPVRSYRKNNVQTKKTELMSGSGIYVKVSLDGAPYLRKIDLKVYNGYSELLKALETMFKLTIGEYYEREGYKGSEFAPAYEDKDGDLMLVGDVPWNMFMSSCKRLRIMRRSDARGLGCGV